MKYTNYEEKVLDILRLAVDKAETRQGRQIAQNPEIQKIISMVEIFLKKKRSMCYGGTAINNILPIEDQFYDKSVEVPDYDFYTPNALNDAKELADIFYNAGYTEVEAKAGVHKGTFKVFVNFIPVADITYMEPKLFNTLMKDSIKIFGIHYCPPDFLRMGMYLELSRPAGDVSRWEKVLKRLMLLNKHHPLKAENCDPKFFRRAFEKNNKEWQESLFYLTKDVLIDQGVVFFGGYANSLYSKYMPKKQRNFLQKIPDFDVLSETPQKTAIMLKERLEENNYHKVKIIKQKGIGEVIAPHYEIKVKNETIVFIYEPLACHSYNSIELGNRKVKIATIDTMLSFYLAFLYGGRAYYDKNRILCMSQYLFEVQEKNQLKQKGVLRRFSINCYGKQHTLEDIRNEKTKKFEELKNKKNTKEYDEYFLRYVPYQEKSSKKSKKQTKRKIKSKTKKNKTRKHK
tara:strand:+ start:119 stop:1492 length:1374 start_codon:yes stop_codon:yes gene_type:complete